MKTFIVYTIHTYKTSDKYKGYIVKVREKKEGVKMLDFYHKTVYNYHRNKQQEERSTFHGDDKDYQFPYGHRYNEPDSDRGATDERNT